DDKAPEVRGLAVRILADNVDVQRPELKKLVLDCIKRDPSPEVQFHALQAIARWALRGLEALLADKDPFIRSAAIMAFSEYADTKILLHCRKSSDPEVRLGALLAHRHKSQEATEWRIKSGSHGGLELEEWLIQTVPDFLNDPDPEVRRAAIQWVAEEGL